MPGRRVFGRTSTTWTSRRSRRDGARGVVASGLTLLLAATTILAGASPASAADFEVGVDITQTSSASQASGRPFRYTVDFNCDLLGDPGTTEGTVCAGSLITIPLDGLADEFTDAELTAMIGLANLPAGATWEVTGGDLLIDLGDIEAGESAQYVLTITPPNWVTPNNTTWELDATATGDNFDEASSDPVTSRATATLVHRITKTVDGTAFRDLGATVEYDIVVSCSRADSGRILASAMTVTDTLPAGLTFVSSSPAPTSTSGQGQTWELGTLPTSCTDPTTPGGSTGTVTIRVVAEVASEGFDTGDVLVNTASVESDTIDAQHIARVSDTASVTVIDGGSPGPGRFSKDSYGQLRDRDASPSTSNTGQEVESHTTYLGNWLGYRTDQPANVLDSYRPNQATSMRQAGYKMQFDSGTAQGSGWQIALRDPVPCRDGEVEGDGDKLYQSRPLGDLCQQPAFHVKTVSVYSTDSGVAGAFDAASYAPSVVYADGSTADMIRVGATNGGREGNYRIPDLARDDVAEIVFPRDAGLSGETLRWAVNGYVDADVEVDSVVRNTAHGEGYFRDASTPTSTLTDSADLYAIDAPQIGIEKDLGSHTASFSTSLKLTARLITPGQASEDFVVTDLLPTGMRVKGTLTPAAVTTSRAEILAGDGVSTTTQNVAVGADSVEVIDNFQGSGRQLVRLTVPQESLDDLGAMKYTIVADLTVDYSSDPGTVTNTAEVFYPHAALLSTCQQSPAYAQNGDDPQDLNGNELTTDASCFGRDSLTVPPPSGGANFKLTKTVQGDEDPAPKAYPGVGVVGTDGGTATFGITWKNTGASTLRDSVVYDIFPRVGDVGVGGSVANKPRQSEFDPLFVSVTNADGVTVEYTDAENPCRDEVFPDAQNVGCDADAWTTTAPSTAEDRAAVTGIRLTKSGPFTPGQGWHIGVEMSVPTIETGQIAWNSVAGVATIQGGARLNPSSPPKVGITASADDLPLMVTKSLDPDVVPGDVKVGDTVTYHLSVSNADLSERTITGSDILPSGLRFASIVAEPGTPTVVASDVAYEADTHSIDWTGMTIGSGQTYEWTVTAVVDPGVSGTLTNSFTVDGGKPSENPCEDDPEGECVAITVDAAQLELTKQVTGGAASFADGPYEVNVRCVTPNETVVLDEDVELTGDGATETLAVPYGVTCTATETSTGGATEIAWTPTATSPVLPNGTSVVIEDGQESYALEVTNEFTDGRLVIRKELSGAGASLPEGPFDFDVVCTFDGRTVLDDSIQLTPEDGEIAVESDPIGPLPVGASCTVSETDSGGADVTPDPVKVEIATNDDDNTVVAGFVNAFSAGTISVAKDLEGEYADTGALDDAEFTIAVTCTLEDMTLFSGDVLVGAGSTVTVEGPSGDPLLLPLGTTCFGVETDTGGATSVSVDHDSPENAVQVNGGSPDDLKELTITATNTFDAGQLRIDKNLVGVGAPLGAGDFSFGVACSFQDEDVPGFPRSVDVSVEDGDVSGLSDPVGPLPIGAECTVTETDSGTADTPAPPVTVTVMSDDDNNTTVASMDNQFSAGTIAVTKKVTGPGAESHADDVFTVRVICQASVGDDVIQIVDTSVEVRGGESVVVAQDGGDVLLPAGTTCHGEETDDGDARSSSVDFDSPTNAVQVVSGQPGEIQQLQITATNEFAAEPANDGDGLLPFTGAALSWWLVFLAVLGVVAGALAVRSSRES